MKSLVIPSAVLIPREMQKKFGKIPAVLCPVQDAPALERLYEKYRGQVERIYVVVHHKKELVEDYLRLRRLPREIIRLVTLPAIGDLGGTVRAGLEAALSEGDMDGVYINFADTLLEDPLDEMGEDAAYYVNAPVEEEWTYFEEADGRIQRIIDKGAWGEEGEKHLFVGSFSLSRPDLFLSCLRAESPSPGEDSFYAALTSYSRQRPLHFIPARRWLDTGHRENYPQAKRGVQARAFNTIHVDEARGILTKTSENREKLCNEIRWYLRMPGPLQYLLPRIYDYSLDAQNPSVSMEYYGYSTLHELLLYGDIPLTQWRRIFEKLLFALRDMEKYTLTDSREKLESALRDIYVRKTAGRLMSMRQNAGFAPFFSSPVTVNGTSYPPLDRLLQALPPLIEKTVIRTFSGSFHIIHGDLCFSNILMEDGFGFIRVIDPRGQFGGYDIYGDERYELAKLLHTLEGNYDFIIEDMFSLEVDGTSIRYQAPQKSRRVLEVFRDVFSEDLRDEAAVRLIEATLFLSMIPLHADVGDRQFAMLATGLELLRQVPGAEEVLSCA